MASPASKFRLSSFLRFKLRSLLVLLTLVSMGLAWFTWQRSKARQEAAALTAIASINQLSSPEPTEPHWLEGLLGEPLFPHCRDIDLSWEWTEDTEVICQQLPHLSALQGVSLYGPGLKDLKCISKLAISYLDVGDASELADLNDLKRLPLERLVLSNGNQLTNLGELPTESLKALWLFDCPELTDITGLTTSLEDFQLSNVPKLWDISSLAGFKLNSFEVTGSRRIV